MQYDFVERLEGCAQILRNEGYSEAASTVAEALCLIRRLRDDVESQNSKVIALRESIEIAVNSCKDVTQLGRFSRSVDPVRWVEQLQAHLNMAAHSH